MRWYRSLLLLALVAGRAPAQDAPPAANPPVPSYPPAATVGPTDLTGYTRAPVAYPPAAPADRLAGNHLFPDFINWMSNPAYNVDPRAVTALYPIFQGTWAANTAPLPDADFQVYGAAMTIALSDRFAVGLNQGGYAAIHPSRDPAARRRLLDRDPLGRFREVETDAERKGWLNVGGFFQYTLVMDPEDRFLLTAGLKWVAPMGSREVFQGYGPLELAPYLTAGKGFGKWHVLATTGYLFPAGPGNDTLTAWYGNVHLDRECFGWLYPLVEFNTSALTKGKDVDLRTRRGYADLGNFEALGTVVTMAVGANAVLIREKLEVGAVYTSVIGGSTGASINGLLVKMTMRY